MDGGVKMILQIADLRKQFPKEEGSLVAIDDFNLEVEEGEFVCILGPSGCGKTTLLRMIAGLDKPTSGSIKLKGKEIKQARDRIEAWSSRVAVFPMEECEEEHRVRPQDQEHAI